MKKILTSVAIATLALSTIFVSCKKPDPNEGLVTDVTINAPATTTLNVYGTGNPQTLQLTAKVDHVNAPDISLVWESSNNNLATVNQEGLVTARNAGTVTISAFSNADESKFDEITLTITRGPHPTWGAISFKSTKEWTITKDGKTQIWSDVVMVERASDKAFESGTEFDFVVTIAKNEDFGNLFSFEAVFQLETAICTYPWRVPTRDEYRELDVLLGGTGTGQNPSPLELINAYINSWGATLNSAGNAYYWTATPNIQAGQTAATANMAFDVQIAFNEGGPGMVWVLAPHQPTQEEQVGAPNVFCKCPPEYFTASPSGPNGEWMCGTFSMNAGAQQITIPGGNVGRSSGRWVRCIR